MATLINTVDDPLARQLCAEHGNAPDTLLEILHGVQKERGFVSDGALRTIADALNISRAEIHGVITFYHDFKRSKPADTVVKICRAEACQAMGVNDLIEDIEQAYGVKLDQASDALALEAVYCLGNCALGPAVMINDNLYGRVDMPKLKSLIEASVS